MRSIHMGRMYLRHWKRQWTIAILVVIAVLFVVWGYFALASSPVTGAKLKAEHIARTQDGVHQVNHFYFSDLNHVYYTVHGRKDGHEVYLMMNHRYHQVKLLKASDGINRYYAIHYVQVHNDPKKIIRVAPSILNGKAVWVVTYVNHRNKMCYHTFRYDTGHSMQLMTNV